MNDINYDAIKNEERKKAYESALGDQEWRLRNKGNYNNDLSNYSIDELGTIVGKDNYVYRDPRTGEICATTMSANQSRDATPAEAYYLEQQEIAQKQEEIKTDMAARNSASAGQSCATCMQNRLRCLCEVQLTDVGEETTKKKGDEDKAPKDYYWRNKEEGQAIPPTLFAIHKAEYKYKITGKCDFNREKCTKGYTQKLEKREDLNSRVDSEKVEWLKGESGTLSLPFDKSMLEVIPPYSIDYSTNNKILLVENKSIIPLKDLPFIRAFNFILFSQLDSIPITAYRLGFVEGHPNGDAIDLSYINEHTAVESIIAILPKDYKVTANLTIAINITKENYRSTLAISLSGFLKESFNGDEQSVSFNQNLLSSTRFQPILNFIEKITKVKNIGGFPIDFEIIMPRVKVEGTASLIYQKEDVFIKRTPNEASPENDSKEMGFTESAPNTPIKGTGLGISFNPLIGFMVKLNIFELLKRAPPIRALGVVVHDIGEQFGSREIDSEFSRRRVMDRHAKGKIASAQAYALFTGTVKIMQDFELKGSQLLKPAFDNVLSVTFELKFMAGAQLDVNVYFFKGSVNGEIGAKTGFGGRYDRIKNTVDIWHDGIRVWAKGGGDVNRNRDNATGSSTEAVHASSGDEWSLDEWCPPTNKDSPSWSLKC